MDEDSPYLRFRKVAPHVFDLLVVSHHPIGKLLQAKTRADHGKLVETGGQVADELGVSALEVVADLFPTSATVAEGQMPCEVPEVRLSGEENHLPKKSALLVEFRLWIFFALIFGGLEYFCWPSTYELLDLDGLLPFREVGVRENGHLLDNSVYSS